MIELQTAAAMALDLDQGPRRRYIAFPMTDVAAFGMISMRYFRMLIILTGHASRSCSRAAYHQGYDLA